MRNQQLIRKFKVQKKKFNKLMIKLKTKKIKMNNN